MRCIRTLTGLDHDGYDDRCDHDTLGNASNGIHGVAECDSICVCRAVDAFIKGLAPSTIESDQIPDAAPNLESEHGAEENVKRLYETILSQNRSEEATRPSEKEANTLSKNRLTQEGRPALLLYTQLRQR